MSEKMFAPKMKGAENEKEQHIKPFLKKVESKSDWTCSCGKEFKKGEMINLVLTQKDIDAQLELDPKSRPAPSRMCDDCLDEKLIRESEEKEKKEKGF